MDKSILTKTWNADKSRNRLQEKIETRKLKIRKTPTDPQGPIFKGVRYPVLFLGSLVVFAQQYVKKKKRLPLFFSLKSKGLYYPAKLRTTGVPFVIFANCVVHG